MNKTSRLSRLSPAQNQFYERYSSSDAFQMLLDQKNPVEWPHYINYFRLLELEISKAADDPAGGMEAQFRQLLQQQIDAQKQAEEIRQCFEQDNDWSTDLRAKQLTTPADLTTIDGLCRELTKNQIDADQVLVAFFKHLIQAKSTLRDSVLETGQSIAEAFEQLPDDWYAEPWYYTYVQYFGTTAQGQADFTTLGNMLDYLEHLGIKNIYLLPHYESPGGDAGYDISAYEPATAFGGWELFRIFLAEATQRGFRVATDLVFNHTSAKHDWFQQALQGNSRYFSYYLKCPASWAHLKIEDVLQDEQGDLYLYLPEQDEKGNTVISKRILIFPDVDQTVWLGRRVEGLEEEILFYREFYPFQVDLDLQHPMVLEELFAFLAKEISMGVLGKRTDAIAHWIKKPGTNAKDLPETYALQRLIKQFLKHLSSKTIILPEVVTTSRKLKGYAGESIRIKGKPTTTGGDALLDFQLQAMLREMLYFQKTTPFWTQAFDLGEQIGTSVPLLPIEHHDETYMGFIQEIRAMRDYLSQEYTLPQRNGQIQTVRRGIIYKNGMSAGARYADALNQDVRRISMAFLCLYLMPAAPVIYYGTEVGATNQWTQMHQRQQEQFETLRELLGDELVGPGKAITFEKCKDPRELQRGPIPASIFYQYLQSGYPTLELLRVLNRLRRQKNAMRSYRFTDVPTWSESIFGILKYPDNPQSGQPLLGILNLSEQFLEAKIPLDQFIPKLNGNRIQFQQLLQIEGHSPQHALIDPTARPVQLHMEGGFGYFGLSPYSGVLWELLP